MTETPETSLAFVDGRDALAYVIIRPNGVDGVTVEANASGISQQDAAQVLRHVADRWSPRKPVSPAGEPMCGQILGEHPGPANWWLCAAAPGHEGGHVNIDGSKQWHRTSTDTCEPPR